MSLLSAKMYVIDRITYISLSVSYEEKVQFKHEVRPTPDLTLYQKTRYCTQLFQQDCMLSINCLPSND